jgi:outer membrane protein assembly factor BamE (lipoprotein component of BamABCDE complex)
MESVAADESMNVPGEMNMKTTPFYRGLRSALCAALFFGAAAVQAASGYTVTVAQQAQIKPGMTRDQVRLTLGRPAHNVKYRAEPGRTWTYGVAGSEEKVFDIDFAADGKVASTSQRTETMD